MKRKLEQIEISEGNTRPPQKQVVQSKKWCFTYNNYESDSLEKIEQEFKKRDIKYIIGKEVGESGTPHLQGYIECAKKERWSSFELSKSIHWEKCKGNRLANVKYCSKDGDYVVHGLTVPRPLVTLKKEQLLPWQAEVASWFDEYEDPLFGRTIHWVWEPDGNLGKSVLATYLFDGSDEVTLVGGAAKDMQYSVYELVKSGIMPKLVIVDIPRVSKDHVSIAGIEAIKNGIFFSPKYEGGCCRYNRPWVLVFANQPPEIDRMSRDRLKVVQVVDGCLVPSNICFDEI
ncbi:MAG: putative viral replication protein [Cressdnaviricota sp.]|nr:MAG: putative viral replication protein [Cressdnaviricota sp.]